MADKKKVAALTGGTGFLGRYIARALDKAGYQVRMLARSMVVHPQLQGLTLEVIPGSLSDDEACKQLVNGADLVVHCAGLIKAKSHAEFLAINGDATARLAKHWAEMAKDRPTKEPKCRFVLISSLAAREPDISDYAASKQAGEAALIEVGGDWLILRPAAIYGPWDTETLAIFKAQKWPLQPLLGGPEARVGLIHVEDMTSAVIKLGQEGKTQQIYELCDARTEGYGWQEIVNSAAGAMNLAARTVQVPSGVMRAAGWLSRHIPRPARLASVFSDGKAREILHEDWAVDPDRIPPKSLWTPKIALDQGFADTTSWYRGAGWL